MTVAGLSSRDIATTLAGPGLRIRTGPVVTEIHSDLAPVAEGIALHYVGHACENAESFADFRIDIARPERSLRRWARPQAIFHFDGRTPFKPLPLAQAFPMLEWGLNWCVSSHCHQYLIVHAAVVEKTGRALILPAPPGSGKSTLCAGLVNRGWRLLSDELTLIEPATGCIVPLPRPVSLKNESIGVIRQFAPEAILGPTVLDTTKGSVAHMRPNLADVQRAADRVPPGWVVLPRFESGAAARLSPLSRGRAFMLFAENAFNYHVHGRRGFEVLADMIERCGCYEFVYSKLDEAIVIFDELARG